MADALDRIEAMVKPLGSEALPTLAALGRMTAAPVEARIDVPRFRASAMDGYALRSLDTVAAQVDSPIDLRIVSPVPAGVWPAPLASGEAAPISTGGPVPDFADAVLVREQAQLLNHAGSAWLRIDAAIQAMGNVRSIGEDARLGETVLPTGRVLYPNHVAALHAYGVNRVEVRRRPRIGLVSTGRELVADLSSLTDPAAIIDSNGPMIASYARMLGLDVTVFGRLDDRIEETDALFDRIERMRDIDIVISTGGVSAGTFDCIPSVLASRSAAIKLHGIRMRPGKPLLLAELSDGRPYFGLPGNPVAALVGFRFFVMAALRRMCGLSREDGEIVDCDAARRPGTTLFLRGTRRAALPRAIIDTGLDQRSHVLRSVLAADTWIRLDDDTDCPPRAYQINPTLSC